MAKQQVVKVTLSSGKVVLLHQVKISHTEQAAEMCSRRANGDSNLLQVFMNKALIQILLFQVDGKELTAAQKEDLDSIFSVAEYSQLLKVVGKISGGDEAGKEPTLEHVSGEQ